MKKVRSIIAILIISSMVFVMLLSGCGSPAQGGADTAGTTLAATAESTTIADANAASADKAFKKYDPEITVEFIRSTDSNLDQRFSKLKDSTGETYEKNRWTDIFKEQLGINVKYRWIASADTYDQKLKLAMASGDIPDMVGVGLSSMTQLADAGLITDMTSIFKDYASPLTNSIVFADGDSPYKACSLDGKLMAVPEVSAALDSYRYLWLRTDWMKKLGLSAPKSTDDLMNIMKAFVEKDPDGNGKKDTYAMYVDKDLWYELEGFFWCFGAYPGDWTWTWVKGQDGSIAYGGIQPEMKQPLKLLQNMYKDGWIDKEFVVKDAGKAKEIVAAGKCGVAAGGHWSPLDVLNPSRENDQNADWGCFQWPGANGKPAVGELDLGLGYALVVNKNCANPEAAVKMLNLYYEKLYGSTGDYSYWGNDAKNGIDSIWQFGPLWSYHPLINVNPYNEIIKVSKGEMKEADLKGVSLDYYNSVKKDWAWAKMFGTGDNTAGVIMDNIVKDRSLVINNAFVGAPTATMVEKQGPLNELTYNVITQIITGKLDADKGFDKYVEDWKRLGGDQITKEVNDWYKSNNQ